MEALRGELVKCEADNILATFERPEDAVAAALAINDALAHSRDDSPLGAPLTAGIGIDFGRFLLIRGKDAFGDAVNTAHKLGEDVARASEVLLTDEVKRRLTSELALRAEPLALSISGMQLEAWRIVPG